MAPDQSQPPSHPPGSFRVGSIGGVDVYVRASWFVAAAMFAVLLAPAVEEAEPGLGTLKYVAGLAFAVLLYLSILLHEMSHALMARRFGLPVRSISLEFLGGSTEIEAEPATPGQEFKVAVVGPLTSIAIGLVALASLVVFRDGLTRMAFSGLAAANLLLGALNLVPGLPLDGGRVLRSAVWRLRGNMHDGTIVAAWGGRVAAVLALLWPVAARFLFDIETGFLGYVFVLIVAGFLWMGASTAMISARIRRRLPALQARPLARQVLAVPGDISTAEAVRRAQEAGAGGILVLSSDGQPVGIVSEAALGSTPEDRRAWVPVGSITRSLDGGLMLSADLTGENLVRAMARTPASEYLLVEPDGSIYGLLSTADVDAAFEAGAHR